jgi:hypothetical protein
MGNEFDRTPIVQRTTAAPPAQNPSCMQEDYMRETQPRKREGMPKEFITQQYGSRMPDGSTRIQNVIVPTLDKCRDDGDGLSRNGVHIVASEVDYGSRATKVAFSDGVVVKIAYAELLTCEYWSADAREHQVRILAWEKHDALLKPKPPAEVVAAEFVDEPKLLEGAK